MSPTSDATASSTSTDPAIQQVGKSTMKAAVVETFGEDLAVKEVAIPKPGPGQALVKLIFSGVCHTDLHAAQGDWPKGLPHEQVTP